MFHKILIPVDLSERNRTTVAVARHLVPEKGGELMLLHVIEPIEDVPFEELAAFYRRLEERADAQMETLAREVELDGGVHRRVTYGNRVREIVRCAEEEEADLIVLGSHPIDPTHPSESWTTISYQVAILAGCPVLLMK